MNAKKAVIFLLVGLLFCSTWARPSNIFVGNQQMQLDLDSNAVSVIHFIRLVEPDRRDKVKLEGRTLVVVDANGESHQILLDESRKLVEWSEALALLGYVRKENVDTGVVDFRVASDSEEQQIVETDQVKEERSMRRAAYRKARENFEKVLTQIGRSDDDKTRERIDGIGQRIVRQSPLSGLLWKFELIETPVPNALCTGEGHVIVTTGLMDLNLTDDELAGVLGHEVAHGVRRHAQIYEERFNEYLRLRNKIQQLSYQYQQAQDGGTAYQIQQLRSQVGELEKRYEFVVDYLKNKQDYDQDEEEESDVLGMQYAAAAGFDPMGEGRALVKLRNRSVQLFGQAYNEGSRTHPPLERRLKIQETVRQRWREERYKR
jgi:peptidase M48-like protein